MTSGGACAVGMARGRRDSTRAYSGREGSSGVAVSAVRLRDEKPLSQTRSVGVMSTRETPTSQMSSEERGVEERERLESRRRRHKARVKKQNKMKSGRNGRLVM